MLEVFWWVNKVSIVQPKTILKAIKRKTHYKLPFFFKNFGDELSPEIISRLSGDKVVHKSSNGKILALGSILHHAKPTDKIWGTGILKPYLVPQSNDISVYAVRGPLTRKILLDNEISCPEIYGDPGILLPLIWNERRVEKRYKVGIIPHWANYRLIREKHTDASIKLINVFDPWQAVVRNILECDVVISSSLHGIILCDVFGVPRVPFYIGSPPDDDWFKYEDYSASIDCHFTPYEAKANIKDIVLLEKMASLNHVDPAMQSKLIAVSPFSVLESSNRLGA